MKNNTHNNGGPWMVVLTNPGKEALVVPQLKRDEFEVYRPMTHEATKNPSNRSQIILKAAPLYPNYLFIRRAEWSYERVFGLLGVTWVFPRMLADEVIQEHRAAEHEGFIKIVQSLDPERNRAKPGDKVKALAGMLEVVVSEPLSDYRVAAFSGFMNGNSRLVVDLHKVVKS